MKRNNAVRPRQWGWLLGIILCLSACSTPATAVPLPDARESLNKAASAVRTAKSLKIKLQLSGAPAYVDATNQITFVSADGAYVAPSSVSAKVVAKILSVASEVEVIAIGDDQWYSNKILTGGKYVKAVFAPGFNAAKLVNSDTGIESALKSIRELKMIGEETLYGSPVYKLVGVADGKDIESLTVGLIRGKLVEVEIYLTRSTFRVERVILTQPETVTAKDPKPTTWVIELFDYDTTITIAAPNVQPTATATVAATAAPEATKTP